MTPDDLSNIVELARRGANEAANGQPDATQFNVIADLIGECLSQSDSATLQRFEARVRSEAPQSLPWFLSILRTLAGTVSQGEVMHHLVLVPLFSKEPLPQPIELGSARHEIEGSLETALNLGHGTLRLLPAAASLEAIGAMSPFDWLRLVEGSEDSDAPLCRAQFGAQGGALVGRWSVDRSDKARLSRKLVHATQRTPELVSWQQRTSALLEEAALGAQLIVYPAYQLQDFFSAFRQFQFVRDLEGAFRQLPLAQTLQWSWLDTNVNCELNDSKGGRVKLRNAFPDEPRSLVLARLRGFCARRGLRAEPELTSTEPLAPSVPRRTASLH
jgi:hypothetical protein